MNDDDEIAESGDTHEVNGREYSVVGNNVYVKGLFGWTLVEDEDEEAEAGDIRKRNGQTYSLVGDKIYCKNWLGGWDEVEDEDERAEAGDLEDVNNITYSRVGDTVYRKDFFGGWTKVEDTDEEAEAGDIREVNNQTYSLVGNTVYRKDFFGSWDEVEDDDECAEAGDIYEVGNREYSRVGDTVYRKDLFGWIKLTEDDDDDEYIETGASASSSNYSYQDSSYSYSGSDDNDSYSSQTSDTDGGSLIGGIIVILLIIGAVVWFFHSISGSTFTYNAPVATPYAPPTAETPAANPYGAGNGQISFYRYCSLCKVQLYLDTVLLGDLPEPGILVHPQCADSYMFPVVYPAGDYTFTFKDDDGHVWQQPVHVTEGVCTVIEAQLTADNLVQQPEAAAETNPDANINNNEFRLLSPADHSIFDYPRYTRVEWTSFSQADSYQVELQLADQPFDYTATSFSPMPYSNQGIYETTGTDLTVQGMGKQVHRVRLKAIKDGGVVAQTDWRYFDYSN